MTETNKGARPARPRRERVPQRERLLYRFARGLGRTVRVLTAGPSWLFRRSGKALPKAAKQLGRGARRLEPRRGTRRGDPEEVRSSEVEAILREAEKRTERAAAAGSGGEDGGEEPADQRGDEASTGGFEEELARVEREAAAAQEQGSDEEADVAAEVESSIASQIESAGELDGDSSVASDVEAAVREAEMESSREDES